MEVPPPGAVDGAGPLVAAPISEACLAQFHFGQKLYLLRQALTTVKMEEQDQKGQQPGQSERLSFGLGGHFDLSTASSQLLSLLCSTAEALFWAGGLGGLRGRPQLRPVLAGVGNGNSADCAAAEQPN